MRSTEVAMPIERAFMPRAQCTVAVADRAAAPIDLSIILPVCNERDNLRPLLCEIDAALAPTRWNYEVIAIDDGSTDDSDEVLERLSEEFQSLRVIVFRKNYGQAAAFDAGFRRAAGRIIATMDADGQNDPADLPRLVRLVDEGGYDFACGERVERRDGLLHRRLPSRMANLMIRLVTGTKLRDLGCSLKVYRCELTRELRLYGEMHRFIGVLVEGLGARTVAVPVNHRPRVAGRSKYGLTRTFKVVLDLLTIWFMRGYQTKPIYLFGGTGLLLGSAATALSAAVLYQKLARGIWVHRNPLFILSMIFSVMAVQFLMLGLLAEIMIRTYFESQGKSEYLIAGTVGFERGGGRRAPVAEPPRTSAGVSH